MRRSRSQRSAGLNISRSGGTAVHFTKAWRPNMTRVPRCRSSRAIRSQSDRHRSESGGLLGGSSALEEIRALPAVSRNAALIRKVAEVLRRTLGIREDEEIDRDLPFSALGMDSLLAIELRNTLSGLFHSQFPSTLLFDHPTLRTLALYLEQELFTVDRASPVNEMKSPPLEEDC